MAYNTPITFPPSLHNHDNAYSPLTHNHDISYAYRVHTHANWRSYNLSSLYTGMKDSSPSKFYMFQSGMDINLDTRDAFFNISFIAPPHPVSEFGEQNVFVLFNNLPVQIASAAIACLATNTDSGTPAGLMWVLFGEGTGGQYTIKMSSYTCNLSIRIDFHGVFNAFNESSPIFNNYITL